MVFSSTVFLFQFLPAALIMYYAVAVAFRRQPLTNVALIAISVIFYVIGSGWLVVLLLFSIVFNFTLGRRIESSSQTPKKRLLALGVAGNLALLMYFKYAGFLVATAIQLASLLHIPSSQPVLAIALPVGISFYTFMSISYLVDVYSGGPVAESLAHYAVYLSLFPHLVAGPIVRYSELREAIAERAVTSEEFVTGIFRFTIGVTRKVVIADSLAVVSDRIFALPTGTLTAPVAWLGVVCYAFQIFYDFSGYTDMAIGLAQMFGFRFPENFAQPYAAASVTDFWRRWHMTLTRWFRDYLYISLGGNRRGVLRTYANLFMVFLLCGLWHGAAWTFVLWGIYHGLLLVVERVLKHRFNFVPRGLAGIVATFALVTIGWVFFRAPGIAAAFGYLGTMFGVQQPQAGFAAAQLSDFLSASTVFYVLVAAIFAFVPFGVYSRIAAALNERSAAGWMLTRGTAVVAMLVISIAYVSETTFRPFIYFRF